MRTASSAGRRRALVFLLQCVPLFAVAVLAYRHVLPAWQDMVIAGANVLLQLSTPPLRLALNDAGWWNAYAANADGTETFFWGRQPTNLHLFFMGLALLPALLMATPVRWSRRLKILALGMLLLLAAHALTATAMVHAQYHLRMIDAQSTFWDWVKTIANTCGQVVTFVVWGLLTWNVWLSPQVEGPAGADTTLKRKEPEEHETPPARS